MGIKSALKKLLLPPPPLEWEPGYSSWNEALAAAGGYDDGAVLEATLAAARRVAAGQGALDRDGVVFEEIQYSWPLLSSLLYVVTRQPTFRVVDVGGALGSTYRQNRTLLQGIPGFHWSVVEQEKLVQYGKAEFENDELSFHTDIIEAASQGADVALFGSSLCYLERPFEFLEQVEHAEVPFLTLDRTPFVDAPHHEVTVQRVRFSDYQASYPCWRFSTGAFEARLAEKWTQVLRWECDLQPDPDAVNRGYLFERSS